MNTFVLLFVIFLILSLIVLATIFKQTVLRFITESLPIYFNTVLTHIITWFQTIFGFIKQHKSQSISTSLLLLYVILFYIFSFHSTELISEKYDQITNIIFITIGLIWAVSIILKNNSNSITGNFIDSLKNVGMVIAALALFFGALYFLSSSIFANTVTSYIINLSVILGGLYLISRFIQDTSVYQYIKNNPILNLLYDLLFVIPCFVIEGFVFMKHDIDSTPPHILKIVLFEAIAIGAYFILPMLMDKLYTHNATLLLKEPIYLNKENSIGTFEDLKKDTSINVENPELHYSYSISSWVFLNNVGENFNQSANENANILNYGNNPQITYNVSKSELQITMKEGVDGTEIIYSTTDLPIQKWNNIVINYENGITDVFINGELVASKEQIMSYLTMSNVIIGQEKGIPGGICNVMYYKNAISKSKIKSMYTILKNKTPPYI